MNDAGVPATQEGRTFPATSSKKDSIFCMKHQISNASASICLVFLLKAVSLAEKLTMNVGTDLELQIPVG